MQIKPVFMITYFTNILQKNPLVKTIASRLESFLPKEDSGLFSLLVKGASGSFVLNISYTGLSLLLNLMLARVLGVDQFGIYAYVMSWIILLGVPVGLGLDQSMIRFIAKYNSERQWGRIKGLMIYSNIAVVLVSLFLIVFVYIFMKFISSYYESNVVYTPLLLALALLPLKSFLSRQGAALMGFQHIIPGLLPSQLIRPLIYAFSIGAAWIFLKSSINVELIICFNIAATIISIIVASYLLWNAIPSAVKESHSVYESSSWIRSAFPLMLMGGMYMINGQADILMLGSMKGTELSGIYQISNRGAALILFVLSAVIASFNPIIAKLYSENDIGKLQRIVTKSSRLTLLLTIPPALLLILFGKFFLSIFGSEFIMGYTALVILSISQLVNVAAGPVQYILVMTGHEKDAALGVGISTGVNIALNATLIPKWGMEGAAVATGISIVIWNLVMIWFIRKRIDIDPTVIGYRSIGVLK